MRSHGWAGNAPASDDEAIERILNAADKIIDERGSAMRIANVARDGCASESRTTANTAAPLQGILKQGILKRSARILG